MKIYDSILKTCPLFVHIEAEELESMLQCLNTKVRKISKNQAIFMEGDPADFVGIVLKGAVQITRQDYYGNRSIVATVGERELFGETFACAGVEKMPVSVHATVDSEVMLINCKKILKTCRNACPFHRILVENLLSIVARKNLYLNQKIEILAKRSTKEKLMAYLLQEARRQGKDAFVIPYDRQGLADYLGVERSAMSAEISKMRKEGILECHRSYFRLIEKHSYQ